MNISITMESRRRELEEALKTGGEEAVRKVRNNHARDDITMVTRTLGTFTGVPVVGTIFGHAIGEVISDALFDK